MKDRLKVVSAEEKQREMVNNALNYIAGLSVGLVIAGATYYFGKYSGIKIGIPQGFQKCKSEQTPSYFGKCLQQCRRL